MPPDNDVQKEIEQLEQRFAENSQGLVFAHLADAYRRAGEYAKAEGLLLHGLKNHPSYTSAYNVLGRVYLDSERYADAHEQFSRVLELDPQNLIALRALGDLAARGGHAEEARSWYERMLQIDPRSKEAREGLSRLEAQAAGAAAEAASGADEVAESPADAGEPEVVAESPPGEQMAEATPPLELQETSLSAAEGAAEPGGGPEPWDIADLLGGDEAETSAQPPVEPVEGLITKETQAGFRDSLEEPGIEWPGAGEPDSALAAPGAPAEGEPSDDTIPAEPRLAAEEPASAESADLESFDLGIMDDWAPAFLGEDDRPVGSGDVVADSIVEGMTGEFAVGLGDEGDEAVESEAAEVREPEREPEEGLVTETMAELYADQGLYEDAIGVYRRLAELRPGDDKIQARIAELERQLADAGSTPDKGERELAKLLELTRVTPEPAETETTPPEPAVAEADQQTAPEAEGVFEFADGAPVAGLEHLDPFAASFDVMAVTGEPASLVAPELAEPSAVEEAAPEMESAESVPVAEELPTAADELEPAVAGPAESVETAEGAVYPVVEPAAVELEETQGEEPDQAEDELAEMAAAPDFWASTAEVTVGVSDEIAPVQADAESAAARPAAETVTLGQYLKGLLAFGSESSREDGNPVATQDAGDSPSDADGAGPDDLEEFQEWLRSLKR
jgi:tetratricopeptide (TPR) repeat protein